MKVYYKYEGNDDKFSNDILRDFYQKWKYRVMWELRDLDTEISNEGCIIIIHEEKPNFRLKGSASPELVDKITHIFSTVNWSIW